MHRVEDGIEQEPLALGLAWCSRTLSNGREHVSKLQAERKVGEDSMNVWRVRASSRAVPNTAHKPKHAGKCAR